MMKMPLLPPSLTKGVRNDSLFSVKVWDNHRLVFESGDAKDTTYAASAFLWGGGIKSRSVVQVSIVPRMAPRLLIGGLPETRTPLLLALCVLTCALLMSAYILTRRAQDMLADKGEVRLSISHRASRTSSGRRSRRSWCTRRCCSWGG